MQTSDKIWCSLVYYPRTGIWKSCIHSERRSVSIPPLNNSSRGIFVFLLTSPWSNLKQSLCIFLIIFLFWFELLELNTIEGLLEKAVSGLQQGQPVRKVNRLFPKSDPIGFAQSYARWFSLIWTEIPLGYSKERGFWGGFDVYLCDVSLW